MTITYSAGTGSATEPRSEDGLIFPAAFVCRGATLDSEAMDQGATALRTMATKVRDEVSGMRSSWMALPASYEGPEQELVYTLLDEPQDAADDLWERLNSAALELEIYSIALVDIRAALAELEREAWEFRAEAEAGYEERKAQARSGNSPVSYETEHVSWREHEPARARNEELLGQYAELIGRVSTAAVNCANGINALQMGAVETGYTAVTAEQIMNSPEPMPWGSPVAEDRNCEESFWDGTGNFVKNGVIGATSMVGVDFDPTTPRGETFKQSWIGAGDFIGSMFVATIPLTYLAYVPGVSQTQAAQFIQERHHTALVGVGSMVGWDEGAAAAGGDGWHAWKDDPVAAATETALNIGTFFIPGVGVAAGGRKLVTGAAKASRSGRGGKHLRAGVGDPGFVLPGSKGISAENTEVFAHGSKVSQGRTDVVEDVDLTPDHGPGTREGGSDAGRADGSADQSRQTAPRSDVEGHEGSGTIASGTSRTDANDSAGSSASAGTRAGAESKVEDPSLSRMGGDVTQGDAGAGRSDGASGPRSEADAAESSPARTDVDGETGTSASAGTRSAVDPAQRDSGSTATRAGVADAPEVRTGTDAEADVREQSEGGQGRQDVTEGGSGSAPDAPDEARSAGDASKGASQTWRPPEAEQHITWQDRVGPKQTFPPKNAVLEANTAYEVPGRGTYYTDGTGTITHVETGYSPTRYPNPDLNHPAPNTTYVVDDRHVFVTDGKSRTVEVHVPDVEQAAARRSGHIQSEVGRNAGPGHDGAHLIQNALGGGRERINIVGMLEELNRSGSKKYGSVPNSYYRMEAELRNAVQDGKDASLDLYVQYGDSGVAPSTIQARYKIDGMPSREEFSNVRY